MKFTPGQLKDAVGISVEAFRHWKRVLPSFKDRNGHSPCFTVGDLLASAIISRLTEKCAIRVGRLSDISVKIVSVCNETSWAELEGKLLLVDLESSSCKIEASQKALNFSEVIIACPLSPVIDELKEALLKSQPEMQQGFFLFGSSDLRADALSNGE